MNALISSIPLSIALFFKENTAQMYKTNIIVKNGNINFNKYQKSNLLPSIFLCIRFNNKGFIGILQIIVVTNDAKGLSVIKDIIINTIFTIQNIISAIILFTINVTPNLFFSKVNFLIF